MERVVTINLNGNSYQLDEPAHDALRSYMSRAEGTLVDNPDKAEILRDLEQAIADKASGYLSPHKRVVSESEMKRILEEMGPVQGASESDEGAEPRAGEFREWPRKRMYRLKDGAVISGVSTGMAAYFDIDTNIIRFLWIVTAIFTGGATVIVYIAMMFLVPSAHTSEEWAAAHGVPFNAQEVIDRAKREYRDFTAEGGEKVKRHWRRERDRFNNWSRSAWSNADSWDWGSGPTAAPAQPVGYATRIFAGLFAFVFSIVTAALLIAFLIVLFSLLNTGAVFGWTPPGDIPNWLAIIVVCIAYAAISAPFSALRRSSYATASGYRYRDHGVDAFVVLALVALAAWMAWLFIPDAHDAMERIPMLVDQFVLNLMD